MKADNAWFRKEAGRLVDALKEPGNTDLLDMFIHFDAESEDGWSAYETPDNPDDPFVQRLIRTRRVKFYLTPEQTARWKAICMPMDFYHSSGAAAGIVLLLAQLMLGKVDVLRDNPFNTE